MHRRSATGAGGSPGGGGDPEPETDPYWDDVQLLLQFETGDGSTTITDSSQAARTCTALGNAQVDTDISKFGGSLLLDGTGDYVSCDMTGTPAVSLTGEFTVEGWARTSSGSTSPKAILTMQTSNVEVYVSDGNLRLYWGGLRIATGILTLGLWHHWALTRDSSGVLRLFFDGEPAIDTYTSAATINADTIIVGAYNSGSEFWPGSIDDVRLTVGVCRYTASFTPPTAAYPTSGP